MKIIRDKLVAEKIGAASRATPWRKAKTDPDFPKPVSISPGITGWIESEVDAYLARKIAEARSEKVPDVRSVAAVVRCAPDRERGAAGGTR